MRHSAIASERRERNRGQRRSGGCAGGGTLRAAWLAGMMGPLDRAAPHSLHCALVPDAVQDAGVAPGAGRRGFAVEAARRQQVRPRACCLLHPCIAGAPASRRRHRSKRPRTITDPTSLQAGPEPRSGSRPSLVAPWQWHTAVPLLPDRRRRRRRSRPALAVRRASCAARCSGCARPTAWPRRAAARRRRACRCVTGAPWPPRACLFRCSISPLHTHTHTRNFAICKPTGGHASSPPPPASGPGGGGAEAGAGGGGPVGGQAGEGRAHRCTAGAAG